MSGTSSLRDIANLDVQSILNQAITDSIGFYIMFMVPQLSGTIIRPQDGELMNSIRLGLYTTTADVVGSVARSYLSSAYQSVMSPSS
jgi:hypothetical protein